MKILFFFVIVLFLHAALYADPLPKENFIREPGTYELAPEISLEITADNSDGLHFALHRPDESEGSTGNRFTVSHSVETPRGGRVLFYWDDSSQTFWFATAKKIVAIGPKGGTTYGNISKGLELSPKAFQDEARRAFP
jgi:hypothetical protein